MFCELHNESSSEHRGTMVLYILRHGDAARSTQVPDSERPLSDLGQQQAAAAAALIQGLNPKIEIILTSPLLRAQQTTATVREAVGSPPLRITERLTSSSDPRHIIRDLSQLHNEAVLLVGHEPQLSTLISILVAGTGRSRVVMKPCSLACVSFSEPLGRDRGLLQWLVHAEHMMKT